MGNWRKRFSSPHLDSSDLPDEGRGKGTLQIVSIATADFESDDGTKTKMLITFRPGKALAASCNKTTWALAKTCGYQLAAAFGDLDENWIGKKITLYAHRLKKSGEPCLRICGSPDITRDIKIKVMEYGAGKVTFTMAAEVPAVAPVTAPTTAPADAAQNGT